MIDKVRIGFSPLSGRTYLYRHGKDPQVALEKRPIEAELMKAIVDHMLHDMPTGASVEFVLGEQWYELQVKPIPTPTARPQRPGRGEG